MPIIEHAEVQMPPVVERRRERTLVSAKDGATSLTIKEVELHPGYEGRLHTHSIDIAIMRPMPVLGPVTINKFGNPGALVPR